MIKGREVGLEVFDILYNYNRSLHLRMNRGGINDRRQLACKHGLVQRVWK